MRGLLLPRRQRGAAPPAQRIRVLPELRSEQVAHHLEFTPAEAMYFGTNFDLVGIDIPPGMQRTRLVVAMFRVATSPAAVLELPEPLWARFLPRTACLAFTWTISGLFRGRWRRARTYAIENNDPVIALVGNRAVRPLTARIVTLAFGALVCAMYERIAFGSEAAATSYRSLPFVSRLQHRVFLELPQRPPEGSHETPTPRSAAFVGQLVDRKGLQTLLEAWELVEARCPGSQLHVIGSGPLEPEVIRWASTGLPSRRYLGHLPQRDVVELLPGFTVLVAPSIRWGRWREQIGLPIKEALTSGLTVVTTTETGLSSWLDSQGHRVLPAPPSAAALSEALIDALVHPLSREQVMAALPPVSARREADQWLHRPAP
jgi:glycosyltransferase involved in cell wall biosynthesis